MATNATTTLLYPISGPHLAGATRVKIQNVAIDSERVTWALTPGAAAYTLSFEVWEPIHAKLSRLGGGPHRFEINCPGLSGVETLIVDKVWLLDYRPGDEKSFSWRIADRRWWLDYAKYTGRHNLRRRVNDVVGLDENDVFGYNVERYKPYSALIAWDKEGKQLAGPQTALGLARRILDVCDPDGVDSQSFAEVVDNGVPVESRQYLEDRPSAALSELLRLSETNFYVSLSSKYRFYDVRKDILQTRVVKESGMLRGKFCLQKNHRTRPETINVSFLQEQEVAAVTEDAHPNPPTRVYTPDGSRSMFEKLADAAGLKIVQISGPRDLKRNNDQQAAPPQAADAVAAFQAAVQRGAAVNQAIPTLGQPILLENVLQVPRTINVAVADSNGQVVAFEFTRGEYVRLDIALAAWRILDLQANATPFMELNLENLRKYWFGNVIGRMYGFDPSFPSWVDPVKMERVSVVRASYRTVYRVSKPYLDMIHSMRAERVTVVDPVTRTLALPFVSTQYCEVPNLRPEARAPKGARVAAENRDDYTNGVQSPFSFSLSPELGIVRLDSMPDMSQTNLVRERIRGLVDNIPRYDLNPDGSLIWQNAKLQSEFKAKVILSVQWGAPNDKSVLYTVKKDVSGSGGRAGLLEIFSEVDAARVDVDGVMVNAGLLERAAEYEVNQILFSHRDVGLGWAHYRGFRKHLVPIGNCRGVQFVCEGGVPYTMFDATEPYTQRPSQAAMDAATRAFAMRITEIG